MQSKNISNSESQQIQHSIVTYSHQDQIKDPKSRFQLFQVQSSMPRNEQIISYQQIPQIPSVWLTIEQMNSNPIQLISKLQDLYRDYGAVRICPPQEWRPKFCMKYSEKLISTRIQNVHLLRYGKVQNSFEICQDLFTFLNPTIIQSFQEKRQSYTSQQFKRLAVRYQTEYSSMMGNRALFSLDQIEKEYWSIVNSQAEAKSQNDKYRTTVEYAADLPANEYGSGFPRSSRFKGEHFDYAANLWNLNNISRSPQSLLAFTERTNQKMISTLFLVV